MKPNDIGAALQNRFPEYVRQAMEFRGQVSVHVRREGIREIMTYLRFTPELFFDFLQDLCGVDHLGKREQRFEVVYQLYSLKHRHRMRIKAAVPEDDCTIDSVTPVWSGADWHERECYDLFGIVFTGHPDLRRILMPEDWTGHPLRKDYPLGSDLGEGEWPEFRNVIAKADENRPYEVR